MLGRIPEALAQLAGASEGRRGRTRGRLCCDPGRVERELGVEVKPVLSWAFG